MKPPLITPAAIPSAHVWSFKTRNYVVMHINKDHGFGNMHILYEVTRFWLAVIAALDLQETGCIAQENSAKGKKLYPQQL